MIVSPIDIPVLSSVTFVLNEFDKLQWKVIGVWILASSAWGENCPYFERDTGITSLLITWGHKISNPTDMCFKALGYGKLKMMMQLIAECALYIIGKQQMFNDQRNKWFDLNAGSIAKEISKTKRFG